MLIKCKRCQTSMRLSDDALGKIHACPSCHWTFSLEIKEVKVLGDMPNDPVSSSSERTGTPLNQLMQASASPRPRRAPRPAQYHDRATRGHGAKSPPWLIPVVIVVVLCVGALIAWRVGLLSRAGIAGGTTGIRKVIVNPEAYAGQTLQSLVIMETNEAFRGVGAVDAMPLFLKPASSSVEEKALSVINSVGEHQSVMIKYQIYNQGTFANIHAYRAAVDKAEAEAQKILDAGTQGSSIDNRAVAAANRLRNQRQREIERQFGEDPGSYVGKLIDITIP